MVNATPRRWNEFPETYFRILEHFSTSKSTLVYERMTYRSACAFRHDLNRFFRRLSDAYSTDTYAARLSTVANELSLIITPNRARPEQLVTFSVTYRSAAIPAPVVQEVKS